MEFTLRSFVEADAELLPGYANNFNIARFLTDAFPHPYAEQDAKRFIAMATQDEPRRILAIDIGGRASGAIGLHPQPDVFRANAELGYWLAEPFWGKGIMTEVVKQMVKYGFSQFDFQRIFARPFGTNLASQKVLEKAGFRLEGRFDRTLIKNGEWLDELVYAIRR